MKIQLIGLVCGCLMSGLPCLAQEQTTDSDPAAPIRAAVENYAKAFNARDAQALAAQWSKDAVYINRMTGESVVGREEIAKQFESLFKSADGMKIELQSTSIRFVSPNVAVEEGTAKLLSKNGQPESFAYTAIYVQNDDQWLLDRVTDEADPLADSNYEHLKSLEWMVGSWSTSTPGVDLHIDCNWTTNRNFLTRSFAITTDDSEFSGIQFIGWDPAAKQYRSWTFDAVGTFAEATWNQDGDQWFLYNRGTLRDGTPASMTNVMKIVDENSFTWKTVDRTAGGEILPHLPEVLITRQ